MVLNRAAGKASGERASQARAAGPGSLNRLGRGAGPEARGQEPKAEGGDSGGGQDPNPSGTVVVLSRWDRLSPFTPRETRNSSSGKEAAA